MRISAAGTAVAALPNSVSAFAATSPSGSISVWTTDAKRRHAQSSSLKWAAANRKADITVDSSRQFQEVLGFGAAFTEAACFTFWRLDPEVRCTVFEDLFHPARMGLSVSRVCVGSSDYATKAYSYDESAEPDPKLERFSIEHDREYVLPVLREARAANPEMWLLASPWSPPGWMKSNGSMLGGSMRKSCYGAYAEYLARYFDAYEHEGISIDSLTPQNEVDTDQDGRMPACLWGQEYEIEFVRDHLGPRLAKRDRKVEIWILDHNYNLWGRALCELEDVKARQYIKGIAWHGYAGTPEAMSRVQRAYPEVGQFWTEGGPDFEKPGYATEWTKWGSEFTEILRNQARCIIAWNYALDEKGRPNIGPFQCAGLLTIDSKTKEISFSGQYWAMRHFSSHLQRGARVVGSSSDTSGISHVAAVNPSGEHILVLTNKDTVGRTTAVQAGRSATNIQLPPDSISTLVWS